MLEVTELTKEYPSPRGSFSVLNGVSLSLSPGDAVSIMGPSGCGKSTLLYILGALEPPTSGTVTLAGCDRAGRTGLSHAGRQTAPLDQKCLRHGMPACGPRAGSDPTHTAALVREPPGHGRRRSSDGPRARWVETPGDGAKIFSSE